MKEATGLRRASRIVLCLLTLVIGRAVGAQAADEPTTERFAGEAQIGSQPPFPIHLELRRSGDAVTGIGSIPGSRFEVELPPFDRSDPRE